jgi:hypothetical protein
MLGVNSGNSNSPVQEALIPPICQNISEPESLDYCQLAVGLVGDELFTETQQKSVILSPIEEVDALDLALLYCDKIVNFRAGTPSNDSDSRDAEMISSHSQNILPGIYIAEAKQHNFKKSSSENPTIRMACVFNAQKQNDRPKLELVSFDLIPNNWPAEIYQGKSVTKDIQGINKALGVYSILIFLGTGTLFTAIGLFIASMFNLGITIYSLDALYRSAFILGMVQSIFLSAKIPPLGIFPGLALQTLVLGITSACVKGLKVHWSDGYCYSSKTPLLNKTLKVSCLFKMAIAVILHQAY